jgi:hypothetical protein
MSSPYVPLTSAINSVQRTVIEATLRKARIEIVTQEVDSLMALGATSLSPLEFRVPAECLPEAKEALCANGVVCEVSDFWPTPECVCLSIVLSSASAAR